MKGIYFDCEIVVNYESNFLSTKKRCSNWVEIGITSSYVGQNIKIESNLRIMSLLSIKEAARVNSNVKRHNFIYQTKM